MSSFKDYFDTNIMILKLGGIWIPDKNVKPIIKIGYYVYNTFWIFYSMFIFNPCQAIMLKTTINNFDDLIKNLSSFLTDVLVVIKVVIWFRRRREIINIIETLNNASSTYEPIDDFKPEKITNEDKRTKDLACNTFLTFGSFVSISAALRALLSLLTINRDDYMVFNNVTNETTYVYTERLPYFSYVPWDYTKSNWRYACAVLFQFFGIFNLTFMVVGLDTLFTTIISYTSAQLLILQGAFRTIRARCLKRLKISNEPMLWDPPQLAEEMSDEMKRCVKHLQMIFDVCQKMEDIYTYVTLSQILISLMVFCTCLYLVSSYTITDPKFAVEVVYMVAIEMQLSFYCYFGNRVTQRGEDMSWALYESDWLSTRKSFKTSMLITMTRMRRPIYLTIGKFSPLTLATLVTISRASYSFFAVIKNRDM